MNKTPKLKLTLPEIEKKDIAKILSEREIKYNSRYEEPPVSLIFKQDDETYNLFHRRGFSAIKGQSKGRKSTLMTIIAAAYANRNQWTLNSFRAPATGRKLAWFDTEQADYETKWMQNRVYKLSGNVDGITLTNLRIDNPSERLEYINWFIENKHKEYDTIFIDGILDLVTEMNNESQASEITSWLLKSTMMYDIHISLIVHENFGSEKASGHVGSSILRRAATVMEVNLLKTDENISAVKAYMMRGKRFSPFYISINRDETPCMSTNPTIPF